MMFVGPCIIVITEESKPTRCHLLFYCTSYRLNMFRALLSSSSGARDYNVDYHIGRFFLGLLQPTTNQERNDQCGHQHYSRELLMMGIVVPETCRAYRKYNKIMRGI